jgi:hypothetical protein
MLPAPPHTPRPRRRVPGRWAGASIGCLLLVTTSCGSDAGQAAAAAPRTTAAAGAQAVRAQGSDVLPFDGLSDWRDYAEAVAIVTVTGDHEVVSSQQAGPALPIGRTVDVSVDRSVWGSVRPPKDLSLRTGGWVRASGGRLRELRFENAVRLTAGRRYLAALVRVAGAWGLQSDSSAFRLDGEVVRVGRDREPALRSLDGRTVDQVAAELRATTSDAVVEANRRLSPVERYRAVSEAESEAQAGSGTPPVTASPSTDGPPPG